MNRVEIVYCTQCRWLLRAAWTAQELLTTFADELDEVALCPGRGGVFIIRLNGEVLVDRQIDGFPDLPQLKQRIRDRIAPTRSLGHSERGAPSAVAADTHAEVQAHAQSGAGPDAAPPEAPSTEPA